MDPKEFGVFIQDRRKSLGMNQAQLAQKLCVTAKAVSRWERGVGFPDIKLLQPLADALEITIAELMKSHLLEEELPQEAEEQLVSQTIETIRQQEALNWKRKLLLYGGYGLFFAMYYFLYMIGFEVESKWKGILVMEIGLFIWHFGSRALNSLLTGAPFYEKKPKKKWQYHVAMVLFLLGVVIILAAQSGISEKGIRDFLSVSGLMLSFLSGCYVTVFEEKLNK